MKYKVIIYDYDGVICDSLDVKKNAFSDLYSRYGSEIQNLVKKYHLENGGVSRYEKFKYYESEILGKDMSDKKIKILCDKFSNLVKQKVIDSRFIKGVINFLEKKSKKYCQYICTGTPENEIKYIIQKQNIDKYFKATYGSPDNKEDIIKKIFNHAKVKNTNCIYFGDSLTDYFAALNFKIPFIGIINDRVKFPRGTKTIHDFDSEIF